jgi:hypothetical protein
MGPGDERSYGSRARRTRLRPLAAAVLVVLLGLPPAAAAADAHDIGDGTYVVGMTIQPGTWVTGGGPDCVWLRLARVGGGAEDVIASGRPSGSAEVRIEPTDAAFETYGCRWVPLGMYPPSATTGPVASSDDRAAYVELLGGVVSALEPFGQGFPEDLGTFASLARSVADDLEGVLLGIPPRACYASLYVASWRLVSDLRHMADRIQAGDADARVFIELVVPDLQAITEASQPGAC